MSKKIMAINSGSSSLKFQLFNMPEENIIVKGIFERINDPKGMLFSYTVKGEKRRTELKIISHVEAVHYLLNFLLEEKFVETLDELEGVGHRVAHGGEFFKSSSLVLEKEMEQISQLAKLAPLHNPVNLAGIQAFKKSLPKCPQVAVFDTSFHQTLPESQYIYPIPMKYYHENKIRRYGFHGTSHQYVAQKAAEIMNKELSDVNLITCHLGNGASVCGVKEGKSYVTSMGFTPLAGLMMGTRSGDIDPSIIPFLQKERGMSADEISDLLNNQSGLLGISELSNDFRDVIEVADNGNKQAVLALDIFISRVKQTIGAYAAEMGGIDGLVFTAGLGENSAKIREKCCEGLEFLKVNIEKNKNERNDVIISTSKSGVEVLVIPTNEELMIAKETVSLI
ncbi:acetate kinase [Vagococcus carniphilus]|uniref:acetate/propionate family kinase n=1 Tax=Vagococcus carniphilus TaxID=218144 RepID=UPI00288E0C57|nr:acetate kinase [Vagococcus carniphilus]MDT2848502.1 acetate kinase [Vagococcus carniphilus]